MKMSKRQRRKRRQAQEFDMTNEQAENAIREGWRIGMDRAKDMTPEQIDVLLDAIDKETRSGKRTRL